MRLTTTLLALLAVAAPAVAVSVQIENFDGPWRTPQGYVDDGIDPATMNWHNIGYGDPTIFTRATDDVISPSEGTDSQGYYVPGAAYGVNPVGNSALANLNESLGGAVQIDWVSFVQSKGGPAPDLSQPAYVTMDILVVADDLDDYDQLTVVYDTWFDGTSKTWPLAGNKSYDGKADPLKNGVWQDDVTVLTYNAFPVDDGMPIIFCEFKINNANAGDVTIYVDDLKLNYVPEPASLLLLALGGLLLRRR